MEKEVKSFQAETKQLLNLMIHSIYTHREIFLRELLSNASDAIDKIRFQSLTNQDLLEGDSNFEIFLSVDKTTNTITISDNGIGMTHDEVVENIGTIAKSGSKSFAEKLKEKKESNSDIDIIGQFGVGFYSAFMVAKKVTLITKAPNAASAIKWESTGDGTYTIEETDIRPNRGTTIILELREKEEEEGKESKHESAVDEFLGEFKIERLVKKYSDYVRYPIKMNMPGEKEGEIETKTLNSMIPLWRRDKKEIKKEEYDEFYKQRFHDWVDPLNVIHTKTEGASVEYTALLFVPAKTPFDFYTKEFSKGLQLYSKNVFIMENCQELLPDYLRFVKGLIDSPDFSLNISREILQNDRQLKIIAKNVEKKILSSLHELLKENREKYEEFWKEFGETIKSGIYMEWDAKEKLQDLLMFQSSYSDKMTTLEEYIGRMKEGQEKIYYVAGQDRSFVEKIPQMEVLKEKGFEVLYFIDRVDEFAIERMMDYKEKKFQSITRGELNLEKETDEDKKQKEDLEKDNKDLLDTFKEMLKDKVKDVRFTKRLKSTPVCIVSDEGGISLGMEKVIAGMPNMDGMKAEKILEINPNHSIFAKVKEVYTAQGKESELLKDFGYVLYNQALLMEGFNIEDPVEYTNRLSKILVGN